MCLFVFELLFLIFRQSCKLINPSQQHLFIIRFCTSDLIRMSELFPLLNFVKDFYADVIEFKKFYYDFFNSSISFPYISDKLQDLETPRYPESVSSDNNIAGLYDLEKTLGSGHFATVKMARHVFTGEKVAVKVIDKGKLDKVSREHLFQEVRSVFFIRINI